MRRGSTVRQTSEPLIVVEESESTEEDEHKRLSSSTDLFRQYDPNNLTEDSPTNPYLLSPWREPRKHSLPTPQCSGITASQVRRLSERGSEDGAAKKAREQAFLATLQSNPVASPGGRRHSVVTISRLPTGLFGMGPQRRESVAAFPSSSGAMNRVLPNRRESIACPPSTEPIGSLHKLQLDIMDDIVKARKVRMKMWNTSKERVCEVQPLDENKGEVQRYTHAAGRRFSEFTGTTLSPLPSASFRRASEFVPNTSLAASSFQKPGTSSGIVCSNTDLISILSSLTSSATEINRIEELDETTASSTLEQRRNRLKTSRSNSFDISILQGVSDKKEKSADPTQSQLANWFAKRHQPMCNKKQQKKEPVPSKITFKEAFQLKSSSPKSTSDRNKVVWDEKSGSVVDAEVIGNAIEVFLRKSGPEGSQDDKNSKGATPKTTTTAATTAKVTAAKSKSTWISNKDEGEYTDSCDSSSICSTLKDLFVK
ncbi:uncharacterized protein LOC112904271 [Agrilus planipennis]|nr:uncharacterized protein LOC108732313 isoform X2 [Agrilus planipennis]XP_018318539.1 uncharacterized protein LOC108732313 isoform X2 [Agrilus planipennis]XP_025829688.1 uncharacterized protein LOC112904271 [Agrilus planipennis]XP_025829689.1 uncharacterized protein LOC112904271 [Agrilus planipennis]